MANFEVFFPTLLQHEGGFVDDPADPGGATNRGVTMATFKSCSQRMLGVTPTVDNLRRLTEAQAAIIYKSLYWDRMGGDDIVLQPLADIVFDFFVNAGGQAARLLQNILNGMNAGHAIAVDSAFGPATLGRLVAVNQTEVYRRYKSGRIDYYNSLAQRRPELSKFLKGWLARVNSFPDL